MKVAIAGSSGLIGSALVQALAARGDEVVRLPRFGTAPWSLQGAQAVVNLAGASVAKRWSKEYKQEILRSRIEPTKALAALGPAVLINASAVGFYGGRGDEVLDESAGAGADFLASVCAPWEAEAQKLDKGRSVQLRTGVVLAPRGGALEQMKLPFKAFVGGPVGSGRQWFPWIHIADEVGAILWCLDRAELSGPVNLAAPGIVTMKDFAAALGRALHRPSWAPVPEAALRLLLGEMAEMVVEGQRAVPRKLLDSGFAFRFADVDSALRNLLTPPTRSPPTESPR